MDGKKATKSIRIKYLVAKQEGKNAAVITIRIKVDNDYH